MRSALKLAIMDAAAKLARANGIDHITKDAVAALAHCAVGTIHYHFGSMDGLRSAVIDQAIIREDLVLIAQGLVAGYPGAAKAPKDLKRRAVAGLV